MNMDAGIAVVLLVSAMTPTIACAWAGVRHVLKPESLGSALRQPPSMGRMLSPRLARRAARSWGLVEVTTGTVVGVALLSPLSPDLQVGTLGGLTGVYASFTAWLLILRWVPNANCGCNTHWEPADGLALTRAVLLGSGAAAPVITSVLGYRLDVPPYGWVVLPMAVALAVLAWVLPASLRPALRTVA